MSMFIAKVKGDDHRWRLMVDQVGENLYADIVLDDAVEYNPDNTQSDVWFKIKEFSSRASLNPLFDNLMNAAELSDISKEEYDKIDFIAFVRDVKYYVQNVSKSSYLSKKCLSYNGAVKYEEKEKQIYINPLPNCIYDKEADILYFKEISKAYNIFGDLKLDYVAATTPQVQSFLAGDIVSAQNFQTRDVGTSNRKRITAIRRIYNGYNPQQRSTLKAYIQQYTKGFLNYANDKFEITSDKDLRLLLYGMQQRLYIRPLDNKPQVATSTTDIAKIY